MVKKTKKKAKCPVHTLTKGKTADTAKPNSYFASSSGAYSSEALADLKKNSFNWGKNDTLDAHLDLPDDLQIPVPILSQVVDDDDLPSELQIRQAKLKREMARRKGGDAAPEASPPAAAPPPIASNKPVAAKVQRAEQVEKKEEDSDTDDDGVGHWERNQMNNVGLQRSSEVAPEPVPDLDHGPGQRSVIEALPPFKELHQQLSTTLQHMKQVCTQSSSANRQVAQEYNVAERSVRDMEQQLEGLAAQLQFFTEFKDYLEDLGDCYDEKEKVSVVVEVVWGVCARAEHQIRTTMLMSSWVWMCMLEVECMCMCRYR